MTPTAAFPNSSEISSDHGLDRCAVAPYADPDEFIREVTDRIWVDKDVAFLAENYEPDSIVHGALGTTVGRQPVFELVMQSLGSFPHHVGQAEDVIWEARGHDAFLSSHLVFGSNPELVDGKMVELRGRGVANCLYRRGRMVEEWVVRDELAKALQRGQDPDALASRLTFIGFQGSLAGPPPVDVLTSGESGPRPPAHQEACELVLAFLSTVWNGQQIHRATEFLDRDLFLHTVGDRTVIRPHRYQEELLRFLAPFPDAHVELRDVQAHRAERYGGLRVSVLWKLVGTYRGVEQFGPRTGARTEVLGVSQFLVHRGRIVREVRVYDEIALRAQVQQSRLPDEPGT